MNFKWIELGSSLSNNLLKVHLLNKEREGRRINLNETSFFSENGLTWLTGKERRYVSATRMDILE